MCEALCCSTCAFSSCSEGGLFSSCGARVSQCCGFSCRGMGTRASVVLAHGLSCPATCWILFLSPGFKPLFFVLANGLPIQGSLSVSYLISDVIRYLSFSFWFTSLSIIVYRSVLLYVTLFHSFYDWVVFHCVCIPHLLYPFLFPWTFRLFPCLGYCK